MSDRAGFPFSYRIRVSPRARNLGLHLSPREGLTVVVPAGFDLEKIPALVAQRRAWIERHLRGFAAHPPEPVTLPSAFTLPALGESWQVGYEVTRTRRLGIRVAEPGRLVLYGAVQDQAACCAALQRWLRVRTREEIVPWLARLAGEGGFTLQEVLVRGPRTRWASCSARGRIVLSYKLLFLERAWVRCVLWHELCHTRVMDHSPRFWDLLKRYEPDCRGIRRAMREAWRCVPAWAEGGPGGMGRDEA